MSQLAQELTLFDESLLERMCYVLCLCVEEMSVCPGLDPGGCTAQICLALLCVLGYGPQAFQLLTDWNSPLSHNRE